MKKVLIIKTGGTLVMTGEPLEPGIYTETLGELVPEILSIAHIDSVIVSNIDSSDMDIIYWRQLIDVIAENREKYDGFVIIHGTDTMAYTASALAFGLESLDKPVILTGSQRPLSALRSDARRNLTDSVELATLGIPEVGICFDGVLLRGCCATKVHGHNYHAFTSPGVEPIARLGVDIALSNQIRRSSKPFKAHTKLTDQVFLLHLTPGLPPKYVELLIEHSTDLKGIVVGAFGLGTIPNGTKAFSPVLKKAINKGIDVLVVTQTTGNVLFHAYKNSRMLHEIGAISGGSMSYEAAITKLMHALARFPDEAERRRFLEENIAGELG